MLFLAIASFFYASPALAHAPRLLTNDGSVIEISQPDVSQAFYGELKNGPAFFSLHLDTPQELYVSILVPSSPGVKTDKSVQIKYDNGGKDELFKELNGKIFSWTPFFEPFAGDNYLQGPEVKQMAAAGDYFITVHSPDYTGKYVLVVGQKESFTVTEAVNTIFLLPSIKGFFGTSPWLAYFNYTGGFMFIGLLIIILIYFILTSVLTRIFTPKHKDTVVETGKPHRPSDDLQYRQ